MAIAARSFRIDRELDRRTWGLFKASLRLLRADKRLVVFPAVALVVVLTEALLLGGIGVVVAVGAGGLHLAGLAERLDHFRGGTARLVGWGGLGCLYVVANFTTIFMNAALIGCVLLRLEGGTPSLRAGIRIAWRNAGRIFLWSLLSGAVGSAIDYATRQAPSIAGRIIAFLGGLAWSFATFFVLPILVFEGGRVGASMKRSADLMRRTWGEQVQVRLGFGLISMGLLLLGFGAIVGAIAGWHALRPEAGAPGWTVLAAIGAAFAYALLVGLIIGALQGISTAVLYSYAATGMLPDEFPAHLLPPRRDA